MTVLAAIGEREGAGEVVRTAYELAEAFGETLYVLHVFPKDSFETHREIMQNYTAREGLSIEHDADSAREFAELVTKDALGTYDEAMVEPLGRVGDPVRQVETAIKEHQPTYLVLGGRRQSPVGKAVFGNKTQQLLLRAEIPVVTVMDEE